MAVADIPADLIINERTSYEQYLWKLPGTNDYRWDSNLTYMYIIRAEPVEGQGLPPLPPAPPVTVPFTRGQKNYLDQTFAKTVNGVPVDENGNVNLAIIDATARQAASDAYAASGDLRGSGRFAPFGRDVSNSDLNTIITDGFYRGSSMTSVPPGIVNAAEWFYILVESHDGENWVKQTITGYGVFDNLNVGTWYRVRRGGVWNAWIKIADNVGAVDNALRTALTPFDRLGIVSKNLSGTDLNNWKQNGWGAGNNLTNSPDGSTNFFYVRNHANTAADNYFQQTAIKYGLGGGSGETWVRYAEGQGVYTAWVKIADTQGAIDAGARAGKVSTTTTIGAGTGLAGGGDLSAPRTLSLSPASITSLGKADSAVQPSVLATALTAKADLVNGVLPTSQIPAIALMDVFPVSSQAAMLASGAQKGDIAIRSDIAATYILAGTDPTTLANWTVLPTPSGGGGAVSTVNGQTGTVVLGKADIGLGNVSNLAPADMPVSNATITSLAGKAAVNHTHTASQITDGTSAFVVPGRSVATGTGLQGGGTLASDRTLSLTAAAQASLAKADAAYQKPATGIPDADLASKFVKTVNGTAPDTSGNVAVAGGGGGGGAAQRTIPGSNSAMWTRIATIDGKSNDEGANLELIISGLGVYGTAARATTIVQFAQRTSWTPVLKVWKWGANSDSDTGAIMFSQVSEFVTELWYSGPAYTFDSTVTILSGHNYTLNMNQQATSPTTPVSAPYIQMDTSDAVRAVVYANGAYPARPNTNAPVQFIGPVQPTTWLPNDEWVNNA